MAGIASQFIDLSDGEYHLIPANANNLIIITDTTLLVDDLKHSPNKTDEYEVGVVTADVVNNITVQLFHYIKFDRDTAGTCGSGGHTNRTACEGAGQTWTPTVVSIKLYYGVS